jgi:hypothetical protein
VLVAAAVCLVAGAAFSGARAMVPNADRSPAAAPLVSPDKKTKGPTPPTPPPGTGQPVNGVIIDKTKQSVKKAKVTFSLPPILAAGYLYATPEQPVDPNYVWLDGTAYIYVISPKGTKPAFGVFPTTTVRMLAFGSIPVSARIHITQVRNGDTITPIFAKLRFTGRPIAPPHPLPCSPPNVEQQQCFYTDAPHVTGPVNVRIDDVQVDGVPVDVGSHCQTATPATLNLTANAGFYSNTTTPPYIPPGLYQPFVGGTLHGPVNVPGFSGCTNGAENFDSLLNGMVSGPGNELVAHQLGPFGAYPPKLPK